MFTRNPDEQPGISNSEANMSQSRLQIPKLPVPQQQPPQQQPQKQQQQQQRAKDVPGIADAGRFANIAPRPLQSTQPHQNHHTHHQQHQHLHQSQLLPKGTRAALPKQQQTQQQQQQQQRAKNKEKRKVVGNTRIPSAATSKKPAALASKAAAGTANSILQATAQTQIPTQQPVSAAELGSSINDAEDNLIQELLAGIPSTAWLPTDPLTSEGWFTDPTSSIITHDNIFQAIDQQGESGNQSITIATGSDLQNNDMMDLPQQLAALTANTERTQTATSTD
ncbi:hypothetical protein IW150_007582, partial [Coemansia sp. RSA 2607]